MCVIYNLSGFYKICVFIIPDHNFNVVSILPDKENFLEPRVTGKRHNKVNHVILVQKETWEMNVWVHVLWALTHCAVIIA